MSLQTTTMFTEWELRLYVIKIRKIHSILFLVTKFRLLFAYNFKIGGMRAEMTTVKIRHMYLCKDIYVLDIVRQNNKSSSSAMFVFPHRVRFFSPSPDYSSNLFGWAQMHALWKRFHWKRTFSYYIFFLFFFSVFIHFLLLEWCLYLFLIRKTLLS